MAIDDDRFDALAEHFTDRVGRTQRDLDNFAIRLRAVRDAYIEHPDEIDSVFLTNAFDYLLRELGKIRP